MTADEDRPRVRIDKQHPQVYRAQIEVAKAVRAAAEEAGLDRALVELVNIRISQINGCAYCLHIHVRDALAGGETTQRIAVLPAWRDTTLFSSKERAALALAESVTTLPDTRTQDQDYAEAARHLTQDELSAVDELGTSGSDETADDDADAVAAFFADHGARHLADQQDQQDQQREQQHDDDLDDEED